MKLHALTRSQRRGYQTTCDCCGLEKKSTAPILITPEEFGPSVNVRLDICSGCLRSMLEAAVRGRKAER